jgi:RHS repeat-associated protein
VESAAELAVTQHALISDADGDGVADAADNCPELANPDQANRNAAGPGDACEVSLVLSGGLLNQHARFQSHKELIVSFAPLSLSLGPDLMRLESAAPAHSGAFFSLLTQRLGVRSPGELLPGHTDTVAGSEVLRIGLGRSSALGGAKASEVYLRLDGSATVSVGFFDGNNARGTLQLTTSGTSLKRVAPEGGARFDRVELRAISGRISLRGPNEAVMFTLAQAQLPCESGYARVGDVCVDIDECAGLTHVCDTLTSCNNSPGSFSCSACPAGYRGTGATSCVDIDECADEIDQCDALVTCSNTAGAYQCSPCPSGYRADGNSCVDIDECSENLDSCDALVSCSNRAGGYDCGDCPEGYVGGGDTGCLDVDECVGPNHVCDALVSCTNSAGSYSCGACPGGYRGDGTSCTDIDECLEGTALCSPLVQCGNTLGSYQCGSCPSGFDGDGTSCTDIDECAAGTAQCATDVSCTNTVGGYNCGECPGGYVGDGHTCTDVDECASQPCDARVSCSNTPGSFTCGACPQGFRGDGYTSCVDIDECAEDLDSCSALVTCGNTLGGYVCSDCPAGYAGDGHVCNDVDECAEDTDQCDGLVTCSNSEGSYACGPCPNGYRSESGVCIDLDECLDTPCAALTDCTNTPGSFSCSPCPSGYQGDGYAGCVDIDECAVQNGGCPETERCANTPGSHRCEACQAGSVGVTTHCGTGACARDGLTACVLGDVRDSCVPGPAAPSDTSCDAVDDDCDGAMDDDYPVHGTICGIGLCSASGSERCVGGQVIDTCLPGAALATDAMCDGLDENCNGSTDEDFAPVTIACGVGACQRSVVLQCVAGSVVGPSCVPGEAELSDISCNGSDDDCDGTSDEDYPGQSSTCGVGACVAGGALSCVDGTTLDSCVPGAAAASDTSCDGIDDDCDGIVDDDFVQAPTQCGNGSCAAAGNLRCIGGQVQDSCAIPVDSSCSQGDACDGVGRCDAGGTCVPTSPTTVCCFGASVTNPLEDNALDPHVVASFAQSVAALHSGDHPSQTPVTPGAISSATVAVVQGRVQNTQGEPASCVTISVVNAPQFGTTRTRRDGSFMLALTGGAQVSLRFEQPGAVVAYRTLATEPNRFAHMGDIRLVPEATAQPVSASASGFTLIQGELENDSSGTRRASLFFPPGSQASVPGEGSPRSSFGVRVKELSNRSVSGRDGMPATLPAQAAFTYAFSVALEGAEAADVAFGQPVPMYVENFLGFPVGETVPVGRYEPSSAQWSAQENGRVLAIVGVDAQGRALVNIDATPGADDPTALGMSPAELSALAAQYTVGQSLWRVRVQRSAAWALSWAAMYPTGAQLPRQPRPTAELLPLGSDGSQDAEQQVLRQQVPVAGTPFNLVYSSGRQRGSATRRLSIPLTGATPPASLASVLLEVELAGRSIRQTFDAAPNQLHTWTWDGLDVSGRLAASPQLGRVRLGYVYGASYRQTARFANNGNSVLLSAPQGRAETTLWQVSDLTLGSVDAQYPELGGWTLSAHHLLDPRDGRVFLGDGSEQAPPQDYAEIAVLAAGAAPAPVVFAPGQAVEAADGSIYIITSNGAGFIQRVATNGAVSTVAGGGGTNNPTANDVLATSLALSNVVPSLSLGPDGLLYLVQASRTVSKINLQTGRLFFVTTLPTNCSAITTGPDGSVYVGQGSLLRRWRDGQLETIATGFSSIGQIAVKSDGHVLVADSGLARLLQVATDGTTTTLAGGGVQAFVEGMDATTANFTGLLGPNAVTVDANQNVYFSVQNLQSVLRLNSDGSLSRVLGAGTVGASPTGTLAARAQLNGASLLSVARNGELMMLDGFNRRILRRRTPLGMSAGPRSIPSSDGRERYEFDASGRHLRTLDAFTAATLLQFGYDLAGRLSSVTDAAGQVISIERDANGKATAIIASHGQRTELDVNAQRYLAHVDRPDGGRYTFGYTAQGLLNSLLDPKAQADGTPAYQYTYSPEGLLQRAQDPLSAAERMQRTSIANGWQVQTTTALERSTTRQVSLRNQALSRSTTQPDGSSDSAERRTDLNAVLAGPGGKFYDLKQVTSDRTTTFSLSGRHSAYGGDALIKAETATVLPSGLTRLDTLSETTVLDATTRQVTSSSTTAQRNGRTTLLTYNGATRTFELTSPAGRKLRRVVDASGRTLRIERTGVQPMVFVYDSEGRLARTTQGARESVLAYTASGTDAGYLSSVRDALLHETHYVRDALGRPLQQTFPDAATTALSWDALGNLSSVTPPEQAAHSLSYSPIGLLSSYTAPALAGVLSTTTELGHNADRQLESVEWPDGRITTLSYTAFGQVDIVSTDVGTYDHDYYGSAVCAGCAPGKLSRVSSPSGTVLNLAYDGMLPSSSSWSGTVSGSVSYAYDTDFRASTETVSAGSTSTLRFGYDVDGLQTCASLTNCSPVAADALQITYDPQLPRATQITQAASSETRTYNEFGELASLTGVHGSSGLYSEVVDSVTAGRDALGHVLTRVENVAGHSTTWAYQYDARGRLEEVQRDGLVYEHLSYDANGNRVARTSAAGVATTAYDAQERLLRLGSLVYTYTANGELSTKTNTDTGDLTTYHYDVRGNLAQVTLPNGDVIDYLVDGLDRRVGKRKNGVMVRRWLYGAGDRIVAELDGSGTLLSRFVYGSRSAVPELMVRGGVSYRVFADHIGSPRVIVSTAAGASLAQVLEHDAFGNVLSDSSPGWQPFGFRGGLYDAETGLVRIGSRDYDPNTGRFSAKDPGWFKRGSANLYLFLGNDPQQDPERLELRSVQAFIAQRSALEPSRWALPRDLSRAGWLE